MKVARIRVRRVSAIEPEDGGVFAYHAIDRIRVHMATLGVLLAVAATVELAEQPRHGSTVPMPAEFRTGILHAATH
jgi:hypothetical protein